MLGHGLEMGMKFDELGLKEEGLANLYLERPLQMNVLFSQFFPQLSALSGPIVKVETFDRDLQLIQQCAACLNPDEFILRLIHKFALVDYLNILPGEANLGRLYGTKNLLRILYEVLTTRHRPSVGYFDQRRLPFHYERLAAVGIQKDWSDPDNALVPVEYERDYPGLVNDVLHILCIGTISHSELVQRLPYQPTSSLLANDQHGPSTSVRLGKASISRKANKANFEAVLPSLLKVIATSKTSRESKRVFELRPEIMAVRYNVTYYTHRNMEQNNSEETLRLKLKKLVRDKNEEAGSSPDFPILPPAPVPLLSFTEEMAPLLKILRCGTFVRLLRQLLEIECTQHSNSVWWNDQLTEGMLHLIQLALFEDEFQASIDGRFPFLDAVDSVPFETENQQQLNALLAGKTWLQDQVSHVNSDWTKNCIVQRLQRVLNDSSDDEHRDMLKWTLHKWQSIASQRLKAHSPAADVSTLNLEKVASVAREPSASDLEREKRSKQAKEQQQKIMALMRAKQNRILEKYADQMPTVASSLSLADLQRKQSASSGFYSATGPNRMPLSLLLSYKPDYEEEFVCSLCLEVHKEDEKLHRMVLSVHACRTSVLACMEQSKGAVWTPEECPNNVKQNDLKSQLQSLLKDASLSASSSMIGFGEPGLLTLPNTLGQINHMCLMRAKYDARSRKHVSSAVVRPGQTNNIFPQFPPSITLPSTTEATDSSNNGSSPTSE
ncbi:E3 ubiquitin-protein ligase ubr2 [Cichlidogyrus casuarinus]|uniref:E3 ubiquitin-protein ligase n=1 Tax=Cichlidogyrus casuarinus TaxID=1844966 RepID=A0ABD2QMW4_9PLAT